jgi:hypothetical protein
MNPEISCPVFRCPKTAVAQCAGYGGTCDRYYCETHNEGALCERCASRKQESQKSGYKEMLEGLVRKSYSAGLSFGIIALFLVSAALLVSAFLKWYWQQVGESYLPLFVVSMAGGVLGLILTLIWYLAKTRDFLRAESVALDLNHPGFYDYYRQWQEKFDKITTNTYP